jgi:inner membrane transporter RhtA
VTPADPTPSARPGIPALETVPPPVLVVGAVTSIQFGAGLAATLFDDLGPAGTSLLRLGFAAVILMAVSRPQIGGRSRGDLALAATFGLALGLMNLTFYEALDRIPLGVAVTVEFVGPLTVGVLYSRRALDLLWVAVAALGIVLLVDPGDGGDLDALGLALAVVAGACWGLYIVLNVRMGRRFAAGDGLALGMVVAALLPIGPGIAEAGEALLDPRLLALGLAIALLSSVFPYSLEAEALRRMPANVFGVLMSLEPGVAAVAGFLVLGQSLSGRDAFAIALVIVASVGITASGRGPALEAPDA